MNLPFGYILSIGTDHMQVHIARRVDSEQLQYSRVLLPLFEAIVNSIHAIEDSGRSDGRIDLEIERDLSLLPPDPHHSYLPDVQNITVIDNGIGFTDENLESFRLVDSPHKASRGAKGLGRLTWLKAFDRVVVESTYRHGDKALFRTFGFERTADGVERLSTEPSVSNESHTRVKLIGFKKEFRPHCPNRPETIARRIIEHCFQNFLFDTMPPLWIVDPQAGEEICVNDLYASEYSPKDQPKVFWIQDHQFFAQDVFLRNSPETEHAIHFCANERVVKSIALARRIPHLEGKIQGEDNVDYTYAVYVTGKILDERVNGERTSFSIDSRDELRLNGSLCWEDIVDKVVAQSDAVLRGYTTAARARALSRVERFIANHAPEYRHLLKHARDQLAEIAVADDKLDVALHRIDAEWRAQLKEEGTALLKAAERPEGFTKHKERFASFYGKLTDSVKSDLAQYVVRRAMVLSFLKQQIALQQDGKFPHEAALHSLIMRQRSTSDDLTDEDHNLWILDERLAYHFFLASDLPFKQQTGPVDVDSDTRPDILLYNRAMMFTEGADVINSAIVVEFKRPERNEYQDDDNPIQQVYDYVSEVRDGTKKGVNGRRIQVREDLPFFCFVVADLTPKMKRFAAGASLRPMPDGDGFFGYNEVHKAYVEVVSYDKLLRDANRRNRAFFKRLNLENS
ncbi:MAG TPA: ATP-binding protein [Longimicrobium sp.]|jgi:hypothetical protein